jgi:hypothetical protein
MESVQVGTDTHATRGARLVAEVGPMMCSSGMQHQVVLLQAGFMLSITNALALWLSGLTTAIPHTDPVATT